VQRATKFTRYLPEFGWKPYVITVKDIQYYAKDFSLLDEVKHIPLIRTGSLDPARIAYLINKLIPPKGLNKNPSASTGGRLPKIFRHIFYPDSKGLWSIFANRKIASLRKQIQFDAIFSTSPPISSHLLLAKYNLPWIADFRDYWTIGDGIYTPTKWHRRRYHTIMRTIVNRASKIIAVSEPIADSIRSHVSPNEGEKVEIIPNGFDPNDFANISPIQFDRFTFIYNGSLYPLCTPDQFLSALDLIITENAQIIRKFRQFDPIIFTNKETLNPST